MRCDRTGCEKEATYAVSLEIRNHPRHIPSTSSPIVHVCSDHKDLVWEDVVGPENWQLIVKNFIARGYAAPSLRHSNLVFTPIL